MHSPSPTADLCIILVPDRVAGGVQPAVAGLALDDQLAVRIGLRANAAHH